MWYLMRIVFTVPDCHAQPTRSVHSTISQEGQIVGCKLPFCGTHTEKASKPRMWNDWLSGAYGARNESISFGRISLDYYSQGSLSFSMSCLQVTT